MITFEEYKKNQSQILDEYLERKIGGFAANDNYYTKLLKLLANDFQQNLLSPDEVSLIAELTFIHIQDDQKLFDDFPGIFTLLMDIQWYLRNNPEKAVSVLLELKEYCQK